jgi:hypothetical protein
VGVAEVGKVAKVELVLLLLPLQWLPFPGILGGVKWTGEGVGGGLLLARLVMGGLKILVKFAWLKLVGAGLAGLAPERLAPEGLGAKEKMPKWAGL